MVASSTNSPREQLARNLAERLGSSLNPCRKQIKALLGKGAWTVETLRPYLESAEPGMAPWDWTKQVNGTAGKANRSDPLIRLAQRLEVEGQ